MFKKTETGKILLVVGVLFLIDPILQALNLYSWYGFLATLFMGWLLVVLGAFLTSIRASAWTLFLMGFYLYFVSFGIFDWGAGDIDRFFGPLVFSIEVFHILMGLMLAIISFLIKKGKTDKTI